MKADQNALTQLRGQQKKNLTSCWQLFCVDDLSSIFLASWFLYTSPNNREGSPV